MRNIKSPLTIEKKNAVLLMKFHREVAKKKLFLMAVPLRGDRGGGFAIKKKTFFGTFFCHLK